MAVDDDGVRAPIAAKRERLIGGDDPFHGPGAAGMFRAGPGFMPPRGLHGGIFDPFAHYGNERTSRPHIHTSTPTQNLSPIFPTTSLSLS